MERIVFQLDEHGEVFVDLDDDGDICLYDIDDGDFSIVLRPHEAVAIAEALLKLAAPHRLPKV